jgi:hypothetical protein
MGDIIGARWAVAADRAIIRASAVAANDFRTYARKDKRNIRNHFDD